MRIGILHPGEMGVSVAAAAKAGGHDVVWASAGRRSQSVERATAAGLTDVGSVAAMASQADVILSVCPPHAALDVARGVVDAGFKGTYVDGNAISPARAREVAATASSAGATFVDGGICGPPAWRPETTRMYLSGDGADAIAELFAGCPLSAIAINGPAGAASALKMCYAAYTKGTTALLAAILGTAEAEGVSDALAAEWSGSQPELSSGAAMRVQRSTAKAWRFTGEMEEIAATFEAAGIPGGFHRAAAEIYSRLAEFKDAPETPGLSDVLRALRSAEESRL